MTTEQVNPLFASHVLNEAGIAKARHLAGEFHGFLCSLEGIVSKSATGGREWSIVKTKLEEASFFAKKAMATQEENQKQQLGARENGHLLRFKMTEQVWIHKETGQLYEWFEGCFGGVIAWEDLTDPKRKDQTINKESPLMFDDEYNVDDYESLGDL